MFTRALSAGEKRPIVGDSGRGALITTVKLGNGQKEFGQSLACSPILCDLGQFWIYLRFLR